MLGLFEQLVAHAGRPVVAVTTFWVKVAQNGEAVPDWDLMKLAQLFVPAFKQPRATEPRARRERQRIVKVDGDG